MVQLGQMMSEKMIVSHSAPWELTGQQQMVVAVQQHMIIYCLSVFWAILSISIFSRMEFKRRDLEILWK